MAMALFISNLLRVTKPVIRPILLDLKAN